MSCRQIVTSLSFFQFMVNLQPSGSWISETWYIKLQFLLIGAFYLTEPGNRTKKSLIQHLYNCFEYCGVERETVLYINAQF